MTVHGGKLPSLDLVLRLHKIFIHRLTECLRMGASVLLRYFFKRYDPRYGKPHCHGLTSSSAKLGLSITTLPSREESHVSVSYSVAHVSSCSSLTPGFSFNFFPSMPTFFPFQPYDMTGNRTSDLDSCSYTHTIVWDRMKQGTLIRESTLLKRWHKEACTTRYSSISFILACVWLCAQSDSGLGRRLLEALLEASKLAIAPTIAPRHPPAQGSHT